MIIIAKTGLTGLYRLAKTDGRVMYREGSSER